METPKLRKESLEEIDKDKDLQNRKKVEAALFIAGRYLSLKELVSLTDVNPILLRKILDDLKDQYKGSAIQIVTKGDNEWKMDVSQEHAEIVNRLATGSAEFTRAEQETLAIIAYKQPIKQSVVIKIRGNKAYDHINNFAGRGLIVKRKEGHTAILTLSDSFYDYFNLDKEGSENV
ncbi:hypothetical protein CXX78_01290 [Candidatus Parvarchaeota archaeon]|nr:MAG: hypothetical protein CXX78_01290 [Candidatus Parvarchaeota archaeon]